MTSHIYGRNTIAIL